MPSDKGACVEWVGPHSTVALTRVLKKIAAEERSGDLLVAAGKTTKSVYFKGGSVVFAASSLKDDRLGETMIDEGRISEREFLLASSLMKKEGRRFGEALLRIGLITSEELEQQLCHQFHRIVHSLFHFNDGVYTFEERTPSIPEGLFVNLAVPPLLLEGVRAVEDENLLVAWLPPPECRLRAADPTASAIDTRLLRPEEQAVLRAAGSGASLRSILEEMGCDHRKALRACCGLFVSGLLEPEAQTTPTDLPGRIALDYAETDSMSEADLLGVGAGAGRDQIERAYALRRLEWAQIRHRVENEPSLVTMAFEIQFRLAAAYHRLLSEAHATGGSRPTLTPLHSTSRQTPGVAALKVIDTAPTSMPVDSLERQQKAKRLLRDLKLHIQVRDWEGAVPLLFELVELQPRSAQYRALLAKAMFKHPTMRKSAERHFLEAIQLSPGDASLHVCLGVYYKAFGLGSRASAEFRAALKLDPRNSDARRHLGAGRGQVKRRLRSMLNPN